MRRFTQSEKRNGELAVRDMSEKAQRAYYGTDRLSVVEYEVFDEEAEAKAWNDATEKDVPYFSSDFIYKRYAIIDCGYVVDELTFEEVEEYLENQIEEEEVN